MIEITVLKEKKVIDRLKTEKTVIKVGRDSECDIILEDDFVSGFHAEITFKDDGAVVEDKGSTNGTFVKGKKIKKEKIKEDTAIKIEDFIITFKLKAEQNPAVSDLQQTIVRLEEAYNLVRDTVADGGTVVFVGTKKQAQENLALAADSCGMPYVNLRWLGGTLTNWQTIKQRISYLLELEQRRETGDFDCPAKRENQHFQMVIFIPVCV